MLGRFGLEARGFDVPREGGVGVARDGLVTLEARADSVEDDLLPATEAEFLFDTGGLLGDAIVLALEDVTKDGLTVEGVVAGDLIEAAVLLGGETDEELAGDGGIVEGGGGGGRGEDTGARAATAAARGRGGGRRAGARGHEGER